MATKKHGNLFLTEPVVGEYVEGEAWGPGYRTRFGGIYEGVRASEWTGEPMHFLRDGFIGRTPQKGLHGIPVDKFEE